MTEAKKPPKVKTPPVVTPPVAPSVVSPSEPSSSPIQTSIHTEPSTASDATGVDLSVPGVPDALDENLDVLFGKQDAGVPNVMPPDPGFDFTAPIKFRGEVTSFPEVVLEFQKALWAECRRVNPSGTYGSLIAGKFKSADAELIALVSFLNKNGFYKDGSKK